MRELQHASRVQTLLMEDDDIPFTYLCHEEGLQKLPDSFGKTDDFTASAASLDVQDYLQ